MTHAPRIQTGLNEGTTEARFSLRKPHGSTPVCHSQRLNAAGRVRILCGGIPRTCVMKGAFVRSAVQGTLAADDVPSLSAVRTDYFSL